MVEVPLHEDPSAPLARVVNGHGPLPSNKKRSFLQRLMAVKSVDELMEQAAESTLRRDLGAFSLTMVGIGEIVGSGIFVLTGTAAADHAGPAVVVSYLIAVSP